MRFSAVIALVIAVVSSTPSIAFTTSGLHIGIPESNPDFKPYPLSLEAREQLLGEALARRNQDLTLKKVSSKPVPPRLVKLPRRYSSVIARDELDARTWAVDPKTYFLTFKETRDDELAKRIIGSEITPALSKWMAQHPNIKWARDDELAKRIIGSEITPALSKWMAQHPNIKFARDDELAKRIIGSEITPALSRWMAQHPNIQFARDDELAKRIIGSEITPALSKWMTQHPNIMWAREY
ncbi:hypothetical protein QCA50_011469 [Cerrena zonata]|uniref:Uncharacterized protein n=1 Tax=Cerrena zonata TaxID=2478898 RepID=A0AAW0G782_9APHY